MNNLTITYTEHDRTVTYSKELPESPMVDDIVDTYLAAYDSFGFQNDLDVIIRNGFLGDTKISIDSENYISHNDHNEQGLEQYKYQSEMYYDAWSTVWDTLCNNLPWDLQPMLLEGSGIENAKETIMFLIDHYNETVRGGMTGDEEEFFNSMEELFAEIGRDKNGYKWYMGHRY